jgi:hypothetical protein
MTKIGQAERVPAFDFTKGALVLIMVLYHWINYFYGPTDNRYLRFLTPSFIFITGFLISNVYFSKYGLSAPQLPRRLLQRGLKVLAIFVLLNLARNLLMRGDVLGQVFTMSGSNSNVIAAYLIGNGTGGGSMKTVAFSVLAPIGYLLILSASLVLLARAYRYTFHVVCVLCLLGVLVLDSIGFETYLDILAIGMIGVIAGYLPMERVNALVRRPYLLAVAYLLYLGAITVWDVIYPLQIVGVCLSLMILYLLGSQPGELSRFRACIVLLGRYSLAGYIAQIAILQFLRLKLGHMGSEELTLGLSFVLAFALTIVSISTLDWTRTHSIAVDKLYKFVFA